MVRSRLLGRRREPRNDRDAIRLMILFGQTGVQRMTARQTDWDGLTPEQRLERLDAALEEGEADIRAGRYVELRTSAEIAAYFSALSLEVRQLRAHPIVPGAKFERG
jgi:hypothetical protein